MKLKLIVTFILAFVLIGLSLGTLHPTQQTQAQANLQLHIPFNGTIWHEIKSYIDHHIKTNDRIFMFVNGDSYLDTLPYYYNNHRGHDFPLNIGTSILAAADGVIYEMGISEGAWGYYVLVSHNNRQYFTRYSHLFTFTNTTPNSIYITETKRTISVGSVVTTGEIIAYSASTGNSSGPHLDLEVLYSNATSLSDPFGWRGEPGQDPLAYNKVDSQCLWNNEWCQETIVEDRDFPITGTAHYEEIVGEPPTEDMWFDTDGNQNGARYLLSRSFSAYARWKPTLPMKGRYEIFAFIPPSNATTQNAFYKISTVNGLVTTTVNQNANKNSWVQLTNTLTSSFVLKCNGDVALGSDTGESERTQIVFDTMKFHLIDEGVPCTTKNYLPIIRCDPTSTPTHTPTATPTDTPSPTDTATNTPIPTNTPTRTPKPTKTPTRTPSPTPPLVPPTPGVTPIPTDTPIATSTSPPTKTPDPTSTKTPTVTRSPTPTKTPTATNTPKPTHTPPSPPPTITVTATRTPTATRTRIPTIN